ncbi:zonular occludens toxin domain-containing protein [Stenotrophomonas sp.]|uniref:zonular occludens toxin family protein n=1 Tax=Stenotrophomonas sp. TaxID=69392 RepID=UPI0028AC980A|nr:zonular occludens toxin domain-containing protein [Stenotrophomonas sp.]
MIIFNEGVPRAGKSYDAVKSHILPALKKGRTVYARLNGLRHDRIAKHLGMDEEAIVAQLVLVETKDVADTFVCVQDESGKWCIEDRFKDALVVIDEVHEFYVNERKPLSPPVENFWALLGQNGGDAVIMTQWINRLHAAVKARIERKNTFQKLTAVGLKSRYRVSYYHTLSPGKFEKVGGATLKYDPAIFPLYDGYAPGAENTEVYEQGGKTVWAAMAFKAILFVSAGLVGAYFFVGFFTKGAGGKDAPKSQAQLSSQQVHSGPQGVAQASPVAVATSAAQVKPDPMADLTPEQQYIVKLGDKARVRLAMLAQVPSGDRAWIQWISNDGSEVIEQMEMTQIRALGFRVTVEVYGVRIAAKKHVMIATAWPYTQPVREQEPRLYNLSRDGAETGNAPASVASGSGAGRRAYGNGDMSIAVGNRAMGTFPESVQNRYTGN